jgi:hypothetical protein
MWLRTTLAACLTHVNAILAATTPTILVTMVVQAHFESWMGWLEMFKGHTIQNSLATAIMTARHQSKWP